jgi:ABC-type multidrug transport system ATPase subunit
LVGVSGSGKTTTFKLATGLLPLKEPSKVFIQGRNVHGQICSLVGYCPQEDLGIQSLSVLELLTFYASLKTKSKPLVQRMVQTVM